MNNPMTNFEQDKINSVGKKWNHTLRGYFSNEKVLNSFWEKIKNCIDYDKKELTVADFGGATGNLGEYVSRKLQELGNKTQLTVVDLQEESLEANTTTETKKVCADLRTVRLPEKQDIILMRSVLSYLPYVEQNNVLENVVDHLHDDGLFFNQLGGYELVDDADMLKVLYKQAFQRETYVHTVEQYCKQVMNLTHTTRRAFASIKLLGYSLPCLVDSVDFCERFFPDDFEGMEKAKNEMNTVAELYSDSQKIRVVDEESKCVEVQVDFPTFVHYKK